VRRLALRGLRGDEGLSLLETVVALLVFSIIMTGLAGSMAFLAKSASVNKARSIAVSLAQKYVEEDRAKGAANLQLCPNTTPAPPQPVTVNGQSFPAADVASTTTPTCITYQKTKTVGNYNFTVTTLVVDVNNTTIASGTTIGGQPITEKWLDVTLTWTAPKAGNYEITTKVNNNTAIAAASASGITFDMQDANNKPLGTGSVSWHFKVCASSFKCDAAQTNTLQEGDTQENGQPLVALPTGNYNCFLDNTNASGWVPDSSGKNPTSTFTYDVNAGTIYGPCNVNGGVLDWVTHWVPIGSCAYVSNGKGNLDVYVTDQSGAPVKTAKVTITGKAGGWTNSTPVTSNTTGSNGFYAAFANVPPDFYYYTVTLGPNTETSLGPSCVLNTTKNATVATVSISTATGCSATGNTGSLTVTVQDSTGAPVPNANVGVYNAGTGAWTNMPKTGTKAPNVGVSTFNLQSGAYYLLVSDGTLYDGSGGIQAPGGGPFCVQDSTAMPAGNTQSVTLQPYKTNACPDSGSSGTLNVSVLDGAGHAVPNVPVTYVNIDGIGAPPAAVKAASGTVQFKGLGYDPYFILANVPGASQVTGYFLTPGAACVNAANVNYTINLSGYMTVKVTIDNQDQTAPLKTYKVVLTDPTGAQTAQTLTGLQDPSAPGSLGANAITATFTQMPAYPGYQVAIYQPGDSGDNLLWSNSYDFTSPLATYPNQVDGNGVATNPPPFIDGTS